MTKPPTAKATSVANVNALEPVPMDKLVVDVVVGPSPISAE
jgi:hypothetical protein